jgi:hypothetical protein
MRSIILLGLVTAICQVALAETNATAIETVTLGDPTSVPPSQVVLEYRIPDPIRVVRLSFVRDPDPEHLRTLSVQFGRFGTSGAATQLATCLPLVHPEMAGLLFSQIDATQADWAGQWWALVTLPYGHAIETRSDDPKPSIQVSVFPYAEFEFVGFKLSRTVLVKSPSERKEVAWSAQSNCPMESIAWSLQ